MLRILYTLVVIVLVDSPFAMLDCESVNSHRTWEIQHGYQQNPHLKGHSLSQFYQSFFPGWSIFAINNMLFQWTFEGKGLSINNMFSSTSLESELFSVLGYERDLQKPFGSIWGEGVKLDSGRLSSCRLFFWALWFGIPGLFGIKWNLSPHLPRGSKSWCKVMRAH